MSNGDIDLTTCDREPIQIPGAIQPHGVLIAVREPQRVVVQVANVSLLGLSPDALLGASTEDCLGTDVGRTLAEMSAATEPSEMSPRPVRIGGRDFDAIAHRSGGLLVIELEPGEPARAEMFHSFYLDLRHAHGVLESVMPSREPWSAAAAEVRRIAGFDRVMIYRFAADGHGEVVGEAMAAGQEPYLGLHYPASDIPAQARQLYLHSPLRLIADVSAKPQRLIPEKNPMTGESLDLGRAVLRSVSPIHIEYLKNMGVAASMSISLVVEGELWGLIACHQRVPCLVPYSKRMLCELFGRALSAQIAVRARTDETHRRTRTVDVMDGLAERLWQSGFLGEALTGGPVTLLDLVPAGGAAVIARGEVVATIGRCPPAPVLRDLATWARAQPSRDVTYSSALSRQRPACANYLDSAAGVLAVPLGGGERGDLVMWLRPELVRTVSWAGDPRKPVIADAHGQRLSPRTSFAAWSEEVRGEAEAWSEADLEAARSLRGAMVGRALLRADEMEGLNRALEEALRSRDAFLSTASHELKTPLATLRLLLEGILRYAQAPQKGEPKALTPRLERMERQVLRLENLIHTMLDAGRLGDVQLDLTLEDIDCLEVMREMGETVLEPTGTKVVLHLVGLDGHIVQADRLRVGQVLMNLMSNALRYGAPPFELVVEGDATCVSMRVRDHGRGVPEDARRRIFGRFERAVASSQPGFGMGLWISRRIAEAHGGTLELRSPPDGGAEFTLKLPRAGPGAVAGT